MGQNAPPHRPGVSTPNLATCAKAVYASDTLKRLLAVHLCEKEEKAEGGRGPLGPWSIAGPETGMFLQRCVCVCVSVSVCGCECVCECV